MSLSRKRKKELKRLKGDAAKLWQHQQDILDHANAVAREASRQVGNYGREQLAPVVASAYEQRVAPLVSTAKRGIDRTIVPAIGGAVGTIMSIGDVAKDARVKAAIARLGGKLPEPEKKGIGVGGVIAIGAGVLAAAGVAYAVWQTFRADDELWVAEDEPPLPNT
ncbi:hypothetical protein GCM10027416_01470 [Okibacterium endophyticum]